MSCNNCNIFSYRLQSACCCCEVRTSALVIALLSIIGSVIEIVTTSILMSRCQELTVQEESSFKMQTFDTTLFCNYQALPMVALALTVLYLVVGLLLMVGLTQASDF